MKKHTNLQVKLETKKLLERCPRLSHEFGECDHCKLVDICVADGIEKAIQIKQLVVISWPV